MNIMASTDPSGNDFNNRFNVDATFDIPKFTLKSKGYHRYGRKNTLIMDGLKLKVFDIPRIVGRARLDWLNKHNLNEASHPFEFMNALLLTKEKKLSG